MSYTVIFRGFPVSVTTLDAFLQANGVNGTYGSPPPRKYGEEITALLRAKAGIDAVSADARAGVQASSHSNDVAAFVPHKEGFDKSTVAYIAFTWVNVFVQHQMRSDELPEHVPAWVNGLRRQILEHGEKGSGVATETADIGLYVLLLREQYWMPQELTDRVNLWTKQPTQPPIACDLCDRTFDNFPLRQHHRRDEHGVWDGERPLPTA